MNMILVKIQRLDSVWNNRKPQKLNVLVKCPERKKLLKIRDLLKVFIKKKEKKRKGTCKKKKKKKKPL